MEESDREKFAELFHVSTLTEMLGENGTDVRLEYHVLGNGKPEWEHMNLICLERKNGEVSKCLFIRQNITEVKEKELRIQAKISLANRKERQYRIAIQPEAAEYGERGRKNQRTEGDCVHWLWMMILMPVPVSAKC